METSENPKPKKRKQRPKELQRIYKGSDAYLEKQSRIILSLLQKDKATLVAIDPGLDDPFAADFESAINGAVNETANWVFSAELKSITNEKLNSMQVCRDKYNEVIFYARLAFPKDETMWREFGRGNAYRKACRDNEEMHGFMTRLYTTANRLGADLITKGYTQIKIDDILTVRDLWLSSHSGQNDFKVTRPGVTAIRISKYNAVYTLMMQVIAAAKLAYKNNAAKLGEYVFRPDVRKRKKK